jgi:predicted lipase
VIYNWSDDTEGFIGYLPSDNSIYVAFRGSEDLRNWFTNLSIDKEKYTSFPDCDCQVHSGFYSAEQKVLPDVLAEVARLKNLYPSASVKTTGHSLGAAMALLTGLDLIKAGYKVGMYNFGQPRVGNQKFSNYVLTLWPEHWRVIHHQDIVPHNPSSGILMDYWHTCTERYEDKDGSMKACTNTCEDPTCAAQWEPWRLSIDDHLVYLGMCMGTGCDSHKLCGAPATFLQ